MCLRDELQDVVEVDIPQQGPEDATLRHTCPDRLRGGGVATYYCAGGPSAQVVLQELEKAGTHTQALQFRHDASVPHPVKGSCDIQGDNVHVTAAIQRRVPCSRL